MRLAVSCFNRSMCSERARSPTQSSCRKCAVLSLSLFLSLFLVLQCLHLVGHERYHTTSTTHYPYDRTSTTHYPYHTTSTTHYPYDTTSTTQYPCAQRYAAGYGSWIGGGVPLVRCVWCITRMVWCMTCIICVWCIACIICTPTRTHTRQLTGHTPTSGGLSLLVHLFTTTFPPHPSLLRLSLVCVCVCACACACVCACVFVWVHVCARTCMHLGVYLQRAGFREMLSKRASLDPGWNEAQQQEAANMAKLAHRSKLARIPTCIAMCIPMSSIHMLLPSLPPSLLPCTSPLALIPCSLAVMSSLDVLPQKWEDESLPGLRVWTCVLCLSCRRELCQVSLSGNQK